MCADCFYKTYPDERKVPTRYKRKQHYIHEKLKEKYGEDYFQYDKMIVCGCSKKIEGCFTFDEKNNLNNQEFERWWNILEERIDYFLENGSEKEIELEKLFYDFFD